MSSQAALEHLLLNAANHALARRAVRALGGPVSVKSTRPVNVGEVRDIYLRRAITNERKGGPVEGFDELVPALKRETEATVVVHGFETPQEAFTIFTDSSVTRLVGILISPVKKP